MMKRLLLTLLVVMSAATINAQQYYACTGNNVNIRKGPGKNYGVIQQIWINCGVGDGYMECEHETGNYVIEYRGKKKNGFILVAAMGEGLNVEGWMSAQYLKPVCRYCDGYPKTYDDCDSENPFYRSIIKAASILHKNKCFSAFSVEKHLFMRL